MLNWLSFSKKNNPVYLILVMCLLVFLVHVSGYISAAYYQNMNGYKGGSFNLTMMKGDQGLTIDISTYMTQVRDSWDNGFSFFQRDPYIFENSGKCLPNGNLLYAIPSLFYLFSSNSTTVYLLSIFFSILISAFLVYRITFLLIEDLRLKRVVFIVVFCVLYMTALDVFFSMNHLMDNLKGTNGLMRNLGYIGRFPHIEFSMVFLIFWFYRWVKSWKSPSVINFLLLGLSLAILQYCYFYFWTAACFFTGIHLFFSSFGKESFLKNIILVFSTYALLTVPFWVKFYKFNHSPFIYEFIERYRQIHTHKPQLISIIMLFSGVAFCLDFFLCYRKEKKFGLKLIKTVVKESTLQLCLFFSVYILLNIQVFSGFNIQSYHWEVTFFYPVFILLFSTYFLKAVFFLDRIFKSKPGLKIFILYLFVFFITTTALLNNIRFGKLWASSLYMSASEKELMDKIKATTPRNSVFMSNSFALMGAVNANTGRYVYLPNGFVSSSTDEDITSRLVSGFKIIGYSDAQMKNEMKKGEKWIRSLSDITSGKAKMTIEPSPIPDNYNSLVHLYCGTYYDHKLKTYVYKELLDKKIDSLSKLNVPVKKLNYFIIYKSILPTDYVKPIGPVLIFENNNFEIYKLKV